MGRGRGTSTCRHAGHGALMTAALVDRIARAVLYEGYMLYPYRPSAMKNRQRFNFGVFAPREYCESRKTGENWSLQAECLLQGSLDTLLDVKLRFLHLTSRKVGEITPSAKPMKEGLTPKYRLVPSLEINGRLYQTWQEAVEREFTVRRSLNQLVSAPVKESFLFLGGEELEILHGAESQPSGVLVRKREPISGSLQLSAVSLGDETYKLTLHVANLSAEPDAESDDRDAALLRSLVSAHAILHGVGGDFFSLLDPPAELQSAVASCQNKGVWPVLAGEEGQRDTMLASPIILYDYPQIAPESPGDLFDGGEIDEILSLRIMTMTDEEKREMRYSDDRARRILERTENLPEEQLMKLHGALRGLNPSKRESS